MKFKKKTLNFQAEIQQLLKLMVNSLYSNKEIFLRELISNASDALDKLRFESIKNPSLFENDSKLKIRIDCNKKNNSIIISDNGIGMTKKEIILNLGTIAKSGTKEFFSNLSNDKKKNSALIGQFGVGFYSGFIVAENIIVNSRRAGLKYNKGVCWESKGTGQFSIKYINKIERGTEIILFLKKTENIFLSLSKIKSIILKYSNHILFPIEILKEEWDAKNKKYIILKNNYEIINKINALWIKKKNEITKKEYKEFYKNNFNDINDPLIYTHNIVEGHCNFIQLLYIPSKAPLNFYWSKNKLNKGVKLYIKRIFIMDKIDFLIPSYLRFVKGIIDCDNLSLNISREILQESNEIKIIKNSCIKRILNLLEILSNKKNSNKYNLFWKNFGILLKEGIGEDFINKDKIINLLRFCSTFNKNKKQITSLEEYINRMKKNQNEIYYFAAENYQTAKNSPHLEIFYKKNIEVLLLIDKIDEWMLSFLKDFKNKKIISIVNCNLNSELLINNNDNDNNNDINKYSLLIEKIKFILKDKIKDVKITNRLTDSPCCLTIENNELSNNLIRILKSSGQKIPKNKQILEININHELIKYINNNINDIVSWAKILYNQAILSEGGSLKNPYKFIKNFNNNLLKIISQK